MILGIDLGSSSADFVLMDKREIIKKKSMEPISLQKLPAKIKGLGWPLEKVELMALTGGKSYRAGKEILGIKAKKVSELEAIAAGGLSLSGKKRALVVSLGTGTCIVSARNGIFEHMGGTGIGGGTLTGLSRQLLGFGDLKKINSLAKKGNREKVDLLVKDVVGKGIGMLPANATASNFAKPGKAGKNDLAAGIINLVAEANAVVISLALKNSGHRHVVLTGKLLEVPSLKKRLGECLKMLDCRQCIPPGAGIAGAVGAAVSAQTI